MKSFRALLLLSLIGTCNLSSCKHDSDTVYPAALTGNWKLIRRECYCPPGPVPNERLVLEQSGHFTFYRDGQPTKSGTYTLGTAVQLCGAGSRPGIYFDAGARPSGVGYTLAPSDELVLDYGGPCDAPVDTYERE